MARRRLSLIVNPVAGGGRAEAVLPEAEAALQRRGVDYHVDRTLSLEHARQLARAAVTAGETAVTLGGDGLVGCVAGTLSGTGGVLGVLPGGRGNDFARTLGVPLDVAGACDALIDGYEERIDVGDVDGRPFIGIASCGFDSDANRIANETTVVKGDLVYAYGALLALLRWQPARFELVLDGRETLAFTGYSVAAANSRSYGGGMLVAPDAELDDGALDIVMTGKVAKRRFLVDLPKVFDGSHVNSPAVRIQRAGEVRISADRPFTVYADGDPIADLPVTVSTRHRALRVISPP